MTLTEIVAACGLIFGTIGTALGVMSFLRDRGKVEVSLIWDREVPPGTPYDHKKRWGVIRITNIGRHPTYISHAALRIPKGYNVTHLVIMDSVQGEKLGEGDPPKLFMVSQDGLERFGKDWKKIIAQVSDSTGRTWVSRRLRQENVPSWVAKKKTLT